MGKVKGVFHITDWIFPYVINFLGFIMGIVPIILGRIDLVKIKSGIHSEKGRRMDKTGVVLGLIIVILNVFFLKLRFNS